ncbi:MAG: helix-turn-helix transcriptional regulator [Syntrophobacteraceae bacterium]
MALGARLKELRMEKRESLQQVADAIGSSKAHIWELEMGKNKNPSVDSLNKLAKHYDVTVAFLIGEDPNASDRDPKIVSMYRDLKRLSPKDLDTIRMLMKRFEKQAKDESEEDKPI